MEFNQISIPCKRQVDEWFSLFGIGDIHEGSAGSDTEAIKKVINEVLNDDNAYWIGMGDYGEFINFSDPRFDIRSLAKKYRNGSIDNICQEQIDSVCELLFPIRHKCLGLLRGNHEETIKRRYHHDVLYDMWKCLNEIKTPIRQADNVVVSPDNYKKAKIRLLYDMAVVRLSFTHGEGKKYNKGCRSFDVLVTHGNTSGRTDGAKVNRIQNLLREWNTVDVVMVAHGHSMPVTSFTTQSFNRAHTLETRKRRGFMTGSFLKTYTVGSPCYGEKAGYAGAEIGTPRLQFNPKTLDMRVIV